MELQLQTLVLAGSIVCSGSIPVLMVLGRSRSQATRLLRRLLSSPVYGGVGCACSQSTPLNALACDTTLIPAYSMVGLDRMQGSLRSTASIASAFACVPQ